MSGAFLNALKTTGKWGAGLTILGGGAFAGVASMRTVEPSTVAYRNLFGDISEEPMDSGLHFVFPLASLVRMNLVKQNYKSGINVASSEGLSIGVGTNVIYRVNRQNARDVYLNYRHDYEKKLFEPLVKSALREIMTGYQAKDLYSNKTRDSITDELRGKVVNKLKENGFEVDALYVSDITLPDQLRSSIENKLKVEQQNEQMDFEIQKQRKEAEFQKERTQIEADRKEIEARGIQKFQEIVVEGVDDKFIRWKALEATKQLAESHNTKVIIIGNKDTNGLPIILGNN